MPTHAGAVRTPAADRPAAGSAAEPAAERGAHPADGRGAAGTAAKPAGPRPPAPADPPPDPSGSAASDAQRAGGRTFPVGAAGYALAWAAVLTVGGAIVAFLVGTPAQGRTLTAVFAVAAVLTAVALHLAALAIGRRRQLGLGVVTLVLAAVVLPALCVGLLSVATGWGPAGSLGTATTERVVPLDEQDGTGEVAPGPGEDVLPEDAGTVWCQAADGSMVAVEAAGCVDGKIRQTPGGAG